MLGANPETRCHDSESVSRRSLRMQLNAAIMLAFLSALLTVTGPTLEAMMYAIACQYDADERARKLVGTQRSLSRYEECESACKEPSAPHFCIQPVNLVIGQYLLRRPWGDTTVNSGEGWQLHCTRAIIDLASSSSQFKPGATESSTHCVYVRSRLTDHR